MSLSGPLFKWFGSKWLSSRLLPEPRHDVIVEPFAGGAGYSLRHAEKCVHIAETDPHISKLWKWLLKGATQAKILEIPRGVKEGTDIRTLGLSDGQALLLKSWQRTNNVGDCWTISPWGNKPGQWTANTRARVAEEVHAVKHWTFIEGGATAAFALTLEATWFVDPPYQFNYSYRSVPLDYSKLSSSVRRLRGQVMVCEAICPKTGNVPKYLPFKFWGERITSRRKVTENHHSKELLWEGGC